MMTRPVPLPDEVSEPFWRAAAGEGPRAKRPG
jgi:hypothetical protein